MNGAILGDLVLGVMAGAGLGALHMLWLWRASSRLGTGAGVTTLLGGALLRLAVVLAGFAAIMLLAHQPALAMAGALGGFSVIRVVAIRLARRR